jgi:predicted DNA-binding transcriptional regulator YafY
MRRADRLFRIVQFLRVGRMTTARRLAEKLQVSERTIYRDVRDLQLLGMPIEGEAGIGYLLRQDFDIPPLMFTRSEIEALVLGARMVRAWGGAQQGEAATQALHKIEAVLPPDLSDKVDQTLLYAPNFEVPAELKRCVDILNTRITTKIHRIQLYAGRRSRESSPGSSSGPVLLGWRLDSGKLVRNAKGLSELPHRPHGRTACP